MRSNLRFWLALSVMLVAGAIVVWFKGRPEQLGASPTARVERSEPETVATAMPALLTTPSVLAASGAQPAEPAKAAGTQSLAQKYQVKNVDQPIDALTRVDSAILMKNALIDTRQDVNLPIPADLRAGENPGAYIVQASSAPSATRSPAQCKRPDSRPRASPPESAK